MSAVALDGRRETGTASPGWRFFVLLLSIVCAPNARAAAPDVTLATVRDQYEASLARLSRLECTVRFEQRPREPHPQNATEAETEQVPLHTVYTLLDGDRFAHDEITKSDSGRTEIRHWTGFDGSHYGEWWHTLGHSQDLIPPLNGYAGVESRDPPVLTIRNLLGSPILQTITLSTILQDPETVLEQVEEVEGARCARIRSGTMRLPEGSRHQFQIVAWLDLSHGGLPRRLDYVDPEWTPTANSPTSVNEWRLTVSEFQNLTEDSDHATWLPRRGAKRLRYENWSIRVEEARLPEILPIERFRPAFQPGTRVQDDLGGHSIVGGREGERLHAEQRERYQAVLKDVQARNRARSERPGPASGKAPDAPSFPPWVLVLCGGLGVLVLWKFATRSSN